MTSKLKIVCVSGTREHLQMAAMFAATAAVSGSAPMAESHRYGVSGDKGFHLMHILWDAYRLLF